jgi:hypothetical protein
VQKRRESSRGMKVFERELVEVSKERTCLRMIERMIESSP